MTEHSDPLLAPLTLKGLRLRNRIMSTSHACGLEDHEGMPGETYQRYHEEKARGGLGLTMFGGSAYVAPDSTWAAGQLNLSTDRVIAPLQKFSERVHAEGAAIMVQITHLGRRGETYSLNWLPTVAPSLVREAGHRSFPKVMDKHDIHRIVKAFGTAAKRCYEGGLDGLETMTAGHLIGQFLSPVTNQRTDEFGGSLENRCRFALMVHEEIRAQVGDEFIVGMRYLIDETMDGGLQFEECVRIAQTFESSGLIDFFNANYGRLDTELALIKDCMPGMASPVAPWLQHAGAFKAEISLPVFHAARITDLATARYAIREGLLDMVAMTRAHIADPQLVNKLRRGEEDRIRPCVGATHCMGGARPTCLHNASTGRERYWPQVIAVSQHAPARHVVVGGGPAGLEAARISAERGHDVVLLEAAAALGGQLRLAQAASWRGDVGAIVDWRAAELEHLGVDVRMNVYAERDDVLALNPDVVIIATGGVPDLGWLDGNEHCTSAWDLLSGAQPIASDVVIYDGTGRHPALTVADVCAAAGADVALALLDDRPGAELDYGERVIWKRTLAQAHITPIVEHRLTHVTRSGNGLTAHFVHELTGEPLGKTAAQVIVEHGTAPADELYYALRGESSNDGVTDIDALLAGTQQPNTVDEGFVLFRIGDAISSRNVAAAMYDALRLCSVM
jgi:2,4-dienoyl-CoA reductase-like NADH-dependent reductase (Old Yellow Enzyme family)/pyruvate/2-oxoglutarate dehydrogenase complex dihydrolipoamide dehydrogenase (E3) component